VITGGSAVGVGSTIVGVAGRAVAEGAGTEAVGVEEGWDSPAGVPGREHAWDVKMERRTRADFFTRGAPHSAE
jgi:hypothetical protein